MGDIISDLKLDGDAPVRAQPGLGEWGPVEAPATAAKKRGRMLVVVLFVAALMTLVVAGYIWFRVIHG